MPQPRVIVVGGGAFGTSTAYHLSIRGYKNVTVLDRFPPPSKEAAATDLNKIIRYDYPNKLYARLGQQAMKVWTNETGLFKGMFRSSGWIIAAHQMAKGFLDAAYRTGKEAGIDSLRFISIDETKNMWPEFTGNFPGWTNLWSPEAGWVPSGQALLRLAIAAQDNGVRYISGDAGHVKQLLYDENGRCIGVLTADGHNHLADIVILSTGANTAALVNAKEEIIARSHCVGIIQLEVNEAQKYKNLPIVDDFEQGILFPPDENNFMKICSCRFITNYHTSHVAGASLGHSPEDFPEDGVPRQIEEEMREFVRDMIPELADRPWIWTRCCWDGDTKDVNFRVCPYPEHPNLYIATAGSGHGFKFLPIIGKYVVDLIEGTLDKDYGELWRWRFGETPAKTGKEPHPYPERDLAKLDGWKGRNKDLLPIRATL